MAVLREMPQSELPREKALRYGIASLSSRELIALLIRTGSSGRSVLETADDILAAANGLKGIVRMSLQDLCAVKGVSTAKALQIMAVTELFRRVSREQMHYGIQADTPKMLIKWLQSEIGMEEQENFLAVYLDNAGRIAGSRVLFKGTVNASAVYPREIFREAYRLGSTEVILVHNHPSGTLQPSYADRRITERLEQAAMIMDVRIADHIIVTPDGYFSFREAGFLM